MERRGFLKTLAAGAAGFALDPERLLWTPKKTIFVPSEPPRIYGVSISLTREFDIHRARFVNRIHARLYPDFGPRNVLAFDRAQIDYLDGDGPRAAWIIRDHFISRHPDKNLNLSELLTVGVDLPKG